MEAAAVIAFARKRQASAESRAYRALALISKASACYRIHAKCAEAAARSFERAGWWRDKANHLTHAPRARRNAKESAQ